MSRTAGLFTVLLATGLVAGFAALAGPPAGTPAQASPGSAGASPEASPGEHVVRVYYFHTTQRCASCRKIEALSTASIEAGFDGEIREGRLEFESVNIDEPGNRHFAKDYALYTKSLVVVDRINGEQTRWKNLPKIWELLHNEAAFRQYVQGEVRAYLQGRP